MTFTIELKDVTLHTSSTQLNDPFNITFSGRSTAILGPVGCGKSTILKAITRLLEPTEIAVGGDIEINGASIADADLVELRQRVMLMLQDPLVFRGSVLENVTTVLKARGRKRYAEALAESALDRVNLTRELAGLDQDARTLSGGQRQRLAIARVLALDPDVIMFDEPTSALDDEATNKVAGIIKELAGDKLIIAVTHDRRFAEVAFERRIILKSPIGQRTRVQHDLVTGRETVDA